MTDFLKAVVLAPLVLPWRLLRGMGRGVAQLCAEFTCWILGHDIYKGICVRCAAVPHGHQI